MPKYSFFSILRNKNRAVELYPYFLGTMVAAYKYKTINHFNLFLYFIIVLAFDSCIRLLRKDRELSDLKSKNKLDEKSIDFDNINKIKKLKVLMMTLCALLGVILGVRTNRFIILLEILCFVLGVMYYCGSIPISRTPLSEIIAGFVKGIIVPFLAVYIHLYNSDIFIIGISENYLVLYADYVFLIEFFIVFIPCFGTIFNMRLASNMCTIREDLKNKKITLPVSVGKRKAYKIYKSVYYCIFLCIPLGIALKVLSPISMIAFISIKHIKENSKKIRNLRSKKDVELLSVKNFMIVNIMYTLILFI